MSARNYALSWSKRRQANASYPSTNHRPPTRRRHNFCRRHYHNEKLIDGPENFTATAFCSASGRADFWEAIFARNYISYSRRSLTKILQHWHTYLRSSSSILTTVLEAWLGDLLIAKHYVIATYSA
jgi:hypothetical protein